MSSIPEQIALAAQARLASQLTVVNALSHLAFGGIEKLIKLNFDTVKQSLQHTTASTQQWMAAQAPQDFVSLAAAQTTPQLEEILSYGRELASISGLARAEFLQALDDLSPLAQFAQVGPDAVTIKVTAPKLASPAVTIRARAQVKTKSKAPVTAPVLTTPKAQPQAKTRKANDSQMSLLTAADKKVVAIAKSPAKTEAVNPVSPQSADTPAAVITPSVKAAPAKPATTKPASAKVLIEKPQSKELPLAAVESKPAGEPVLEKKSAVKFPFPANPKKPGNKPSFPASTGRPGYKAKGSAATGAKKPVRQ